MIYLDTSALMKLVRREAETDALREWLIARPEQPTVTSELGRVEILRAARRVSEPVLAEARAVVGDLDLIRLDRAVQDVASDIGDRSFAPSMLCIWRQRCCSAMHSRRSSPTTSGSPMGPKPPASPSSRRAGPRRTTKTRADRALRARGPDARDRRPHRPRQDRARAAR